MAKEAICALLAILEHFFEAFSSIDLFFALASFRPVPRPFPASLHPGCRRFPPLPIPFLHRFQPIPSPARPLKSTSSRPGSHPSRRHPPVLSSSSEFLSLSTSVTLRGRLPSPHRLSSRRLVAIARATTPSASPQAIMSAPAPSCASQPLPDPVGHADHGQNAAWMGWSRPSLTEFSAAVPARDRAVVRRELERVLATRHTGDVLLGGASGAGSLLLNTKASQEAACSRAPAAIVPGLGARVTRRRCEPIRRKRLTPGGGTGHRRG